MPLGWAIVSTGRHPDQKVAPAINADGGSAIAAVVSRGAERARAFADKHGASAAAAYDDYGAMLRDPAVGAVYLASPNHLHAEQTAQAAAAGKHVLCEKPMALTLADCRRMVDACREAGVKLGVGFHLRAHPGLQRLRALVAEGALGGVSIAAASWVRGVRGQTAPPPRPPSQEWWEEPAMAGAGVMMATGVHCVDALRYALGREVAEVAAMNDATSGAPLEHMLAMLLRFDGGAIGQVVTSRRTPDWPSQDVAVYGSEGRGALVGGVDTTLTGELAVDTQSAQERTAFDPPDPIAVYTGQVEAFRRAVEEGGEPLATGEDGLRAGEVTLAMVESARSGRRVSVGA